MDLYAMRTLLGKMKGVGKAPPLTGVREALMAFIGSGLALTAIAALHEVCADSIGLPLLMAPFGASAVLVFGAFNSPLAQPRNVVGGHILSALVGVTVFQLLGSFPALAVGVAVAAAIAVMHLTGTLHPPGGATAFVAVAGGSAIHELGYWYALMPCALGSGLMVALALLINNLPKKQRYPQFW